jgi:hypothetical protein
VTNEEKKPGTAAKIILRVPREEDFPNPSTP